VVPEIDLRIFGHNLGVEIEERVGARHFRVVVPRSGKVVVEAVRAGA
jgi:hypothetical protein